MKLVNIDYLPGEEIIEVLGLVKGTIVQSKNIGVYEPSDEFGDVRIVAVHLLDRCLFDKRGGFGRQDDDIRKYGDIFFVCSTSYHVIRHARHVVHNLS